MNRAGVLLTVIFAIAAIALPFFLKSFGIYLISMWAVLTIATIGAAGMAPRARGCLDQIGGAGKGFTLCRMAGAQLCGGKVVIPLRFREL